jgi:15-cis-phytoene synthase
MTERDKILAETFRKGSKTYFNSSLLFPKKMRDDVFRLYGFVRTADNFVDSIPQDRKGFHEFCRAYRDCMKRGGLSGNIIIDEFVSLSREKSFDPAWTEAFLYSMELDLKKKTYRTLDETLEYIYGSAEVIGLYMALIMNIKEDAYEGAKILGRAMQYINFIRDIDEDNSLGRTYLPLDGALPDLMTGTAQSRSNEFVSFIRKQIDLYQKWQNDAVKGFDSIPYRPLIAIKTASDMYYWTSKKIYRDPFVIYRKKVKPSKIRIIAALAMNSIKLLFRRK